jgi:hypothetical protein
VLLRDLFFFRFADTPALARTFQWAGVGSGMHYFTKRLTQLWRAGYVERFTPAFSRYLHGSRHFLYTIGSGKTSAAARTGLRPDAIPEDRWHDVLAEAAPARLRARDVLLAIGVDGAEIDRVLNNNTVAAFRFISGDTSGVKHHALAAEALSSIWFRARMEGYQVEDIQPDGVADLSFREPESHRHRDLVSSDGMVVIKPDCLFTIAGQRYALEAETGTSSAAKVHFKVRRYARRIAVCDPHLRVLIYCATDVHRRVVHDAIAAVGEVRIATAIADTGLV